MPAKSLIDAFADDLNTNLYGNPHSASTPSHLAGRRIDEIRERTLRFFTADPKDFDLIFVANATAAVHLVGSCFRDYVQSLPSNSVSKKKPSFFYGYSGDCHNSLIGVRELSNTHRCFPNDSQVEAWLTSPPSSMNKGSPRSHDVTLFAYPGQSNFDGRRLPLTWPRKIREGPCSVNTYTLLDAAALATTSPLNLDAIQPDFCCLSLYKIFGFPDLGALIVRKSTGGPILLSRKYFGGGTVDIVTSSHSSSSTTSSPSHGGSGSWHLKRHPNTGSPLHESLEEGTLPFHTIIALSHSLDTHHKLFGASPMHAISARTSKLCSYAYNSMTSLTHSAGQPLFNIYTNPSLSTYGDPTTQGGIVAFNVLRADGSVIGFKDVERAADAHSIYVRSGGHCNPGGVSRALGWSGEEMWRAYREMVHSCSHTVQVVSGRATGVVRISLGACSVKRDIDDFLAFVREEYGDKGVAAMGDKELVASCQAISSVVDSRADNLDLADDGGVEMVSLNRAWSSMSSGLQEVRA